MRFWASRAGLAIALVAGVLCDASGQTFEVSHDFDGTDGSGPRGVLTPGPGGSWYGVTVRGGSSSACPNGCGTVFQMLPDGSVTTLHSFDLTDGALPIAGVLLASDGGLYGTAVQGGMNSECGVVFRIDSNGTFDVMHHFDQTDGCSPGGALVEPVPGEIWGTTQQGGIGECPDWKPGCGTVFRMQLDGDFQTMHHLDNTEGPGANDLLLADDGNLYGTTQNGGINCDESDPPLGCGTVFRVTFNGNFSNLHSFTGDGDTPSRGLVQASTGELIGTTDYPDSGTVFRLSLAGDFATIHTFPPDRSEGDDPYGPLLLANDGLLYGITWTGGAHDGGTIFSIDTQGTFATVFDFEPSETWFPIAGLVQSPDGRLYGLTDAGALTPHGAVYRLSLPGLLRSYCPNAAVRRDQMAVFLLKTAHGAGFDPPDCSGQFPDVACPSQFADWIEQLAAEGITAGCAGGNYCPLSAVTRAQMAVFLLKTEHGAAYLPPPCTGVFPDVPCPSLFADWIEQLASEGITGGCAGGNYCPDLPVTRAQMAVFLLKMEHGGAYQPPPCAPVFADVTCPSLFAPWIEQLATEGITAGCAGPP